MGTEKAGGDGARSVTRRVLLTAGGLTLLGIYYSDGGHPMPVAGRIGEAHQGQVSLANARTTIEPPGRPGPVRTRPARGGTARTEPVTRQPARTRLAAARHDAGVAEEPMDHIDDGRTAIALTIDDGPNPVYTPQVLRLLDQYRVTATFSMIGVQAAAHPGVAREVAAAGHVIANHTWTHLNLAWLPPVLVGDQIDRGTAAIHSATGRVPHLFRAPYGAWSPLVLQRCAQARMIPLGWSVDPRDWSRPGVPAIIANIMRNTRGGSIILEHDGGGNRSQTVAALKYVIPRLLAAGYHFRTP